MPVRLVRILSILLLASPSLAYAQPTALSDLHDAARKSREVPEPWVAYGDALLSAERYSKAEDAFIKASRYTKAALPHIRLGDTYMRMKGKTRKAMTKYRKARRRDPSSMEAQMGVARALIQLGNTEAEDEIYRTIALDSTHAAAHLMLAEFYRDTEEPIAMLLAYQDYLKLAPNDVEGHLGLALAYTEQGRYDLVMAITTQMYAIHHDKRYLAYLGQAMAARGDAEEAVRNFRIYILNLMPDQKALYEDLTLVATAEELLTYQALPSSQRPKFLREFWRRRDLTLTSGGLAREAEHYRRVWYALTHFSKAEKPWDKRGELYIRYGKPDYRSVSYRDNELPRAAVQAIKRRNANDLFNSGTRYDTTVGDIARLPRKSSVDATSMERDVRGIGRAGDRGESAGWSWEVVIDGQVYLNKPTGLEIGYVGPVYPIPRDTNGNPALPWESWVYTNIGGGIEVVFVDRFMNGRWDYAEMPSLFHAALASQALEFQPAQAVARVASETPEYFNTPPGIEPLDFYYDVATYHFDDHRSRAEIYLGIPPNQIGFSKTFGDHIAKLTRTIVLADTDRNEVARQSNDLNFSLGKSPESYTAQASFIPDIMKVYAAPGNYRLAVQVTDKVSGKWGVYHQKLTIPAYVDTFSISDIHVAWEFSNENGDDRFKKADPAPSQAAVWVTPMPTRNYLKKQKVRLYYEVYNLTKDAFGQTQYAIAYRVRQQISKSGGLFGSVASGFEKLFSSQEPNVVVSYESTGSTASEPIYFELHADKLEEGLNEVSVTITDLLTQQAVTKKAVFKISSQSRQKNRFLESTDQEFDDMMQR